MSIAMAATAVLLRSRSNPIVHALTARLGDLDPADDAPIPAALRRSNDVVIDDVDGHRVVTVTPTAGSSGIELVYLHGGSYLHPIVWPHWAIIGDLAARTGATVTVPSYGLAPEHTVEHAQPFLDLVGARIASRAGSAPLVFAGDSAGAGMAVAAAMHARDTGSRQADLLLLFSPWLDVTMTNPAIAAIERLDPSLDREELREAGRLWAGARDTADPSVSPVFGRLDGLPPMVTYQGGHDILAPDARRFSDLVRAAGGSSTMRYFPGAFHVFVGAGWTPEAKSALRDAAAQVRAVRGG